MYAYARVGTCGGGGGGGGDYGRVRGGSGSSSGDAECVDNKHKAAGLKVCHRPVHFLILALILVMS